MQQKMFNVRQTDIICTHNRPSEGVPVNLLFAILRLAHQTLMFTWDGPFTDDRPRDLLREVEIDNKGLTEGG